MKELKTFDVFVAEAASDEVVYGVSGSLVSGSMDREKHRNAMQKLGARLRSPAETKSRDNEWVVSSAQVAAVEKYLSQFDKTMWGRNK